MPIECQQLDERASPIPVCPACRRYIFYPFMRGQVQRSKRRFWLFGPRRPYCAVICEHCKEIVGWEEP